MSKLHEDWVTAYNVCESTLVRKDNVSSPGANPLHHFSWRSRKKRNRSWALALVWVKCQRHSDQYILSYCISVIWSVDVGRGSSQPKFLTLSEFYHVGCKTMTTVVLQPVSAWCKTAVLEPRPKISPYSSCDGYPSSGMAKKHIYISHKVLPVVILQVKDERLCTT